MAKQVHVVPHMHWDREWYFTAEESKILLMNNMEEIMSRLENDENYPSYTLDGQTVILEDYFSIMPQNRERVKRLVEQGRLIIGPWYTQTDEMVVGQESIVRNLLYGHKDCAEFGEIMKIGYLPDSFGQSSQLPMILNGFDINRCMFWRGTSERYGTDKTEFYWKSDDGSRVLTQLLPLGYAIGKYLPTDFDELKNRCDKYMPVLDKGATTDHIIIPNGHDQMPIQKNINDVLKQLHNVYPDKTFFLSDYESVFDELEKSDNFYTVQGEFLDGKYMRVHRSIFSSRADIKSMNTRIENKITNILEPLASMAYSLGFEYYHGYIESIWKEIMQNHAHDSIGCCCSDHVHQDIINRFFTAEEKVDKLIAYYKRKITDAIDKKISLDKLTVFNLLPYDRHQVVEAHITTRMKVFKLVDENKRDVDFEIVNQEVVDAGLIDRQIVHYGNYNPFIRYTIQVHCDIPSMGYMTYFIVENDSLPKVNKQKIEHIENKFYDIEFNENGTINIFDKIREIRYAEVLKLEDGSDDGDGYDYSPLENDFIVTSENVEARIDVSKEGYKSVAQISYTLDCPKDLESRKQRKLDSSIDVKFDVELFDDSPFIKINTTIDNKAKDHRVRLLIPSEICGKNSVSDNQFGMIRRSVIDEAIKVWQKENWSERPDAIYPMLSYVSIEDSHITAITNSVREFEIIGDEYNQLAITLFRCTGYLGKEDLLRRPGRPSGIKMETPNQQLLKNMQFEISLATYDNSEELAGLAKECLTPITTYNKMPYNAMKMNDVEFTAPYSYSLFKQENDKLTLSTVKKAEKEEGLVLRFFNTANDVQCLCLNKEVDKALNLNEEQCDRDTCLKTNQVGSFLIKL